MQLFELLHPWLLRRETVHMKWAQVLLDEIASEFREGSVTLSPSATGTTLAEIEKPEDISGASGNFPFNQGMYIPLHSEELISTGRAPIETSSL